MKKKRIAFFTQWYFPEKIGCSSRIYNYCKSFSKYYDVDVICPIPAFPFGTFEKQSKLIQKENIENINIIRLYNYIPGKKDYLFKRYINFLLFPIIASFFLFLKRKRYDLVITTSPPIFISMIGYFGNMIFKKRWIMDIRDTWIENAINLKYLKENGLTHKLLTKFEKEVFKNCNYLVFFTRTVKNHYKNKYLKLKLEDKSFILYNGVDTSLFKPMTKWYEKKDQILYHGNIGVAQDLLVFIKSIKKIDKKIKFILYGTGDKMDEIKNFIRENSLEDVVRIEKPVDNEKIPYIINQFKIGIVSLKQNVGLDYTVPTKLLEYMACGIPVIASKLKEIDQILSKSNAGLTSNNDEEDLKKNLKILLENNERAEKMGKNGRKYVLNNFNWNENIKPLINLIDKMEYT